MPTPITFRSQKDLEAFIARVAKPLVEKAATKAAADAITEKMAFRSKKETASATSSYQIGTRNPTGQGGGNIGAAGTVTGSVTAHNGVELPALVNLLAVLDSIGFIKNETTA